MVAVLSVGWVNGSRVLDDGSMVARARISNRGTSLSGGACVLLVFRPTNKSTVGSKNEALHPRIHDAEVQLLFRTSLMPHWVSTLCQFWIPCCSIPAAMLVARKNRWAPVFGLLSQPAWYYSTITTEQWGTLALCVFYTYAWAETTYRWWKSR